MKCASLREEKKLWKKGYKAVACLDEAGRGPLAGPVAAAAVMIENPKLQFKSQNLKDSKQLTAKRRDQFYKLITENKNIKWGIGVVSEKMIDKVNILVATKLAMKRALANLKAKLGKRKIDFLILDGNMKLDLAIPQKSIVKGDERVFSCALASILAKVKRDRIMTKSHEKYPEYRFDLHKGYGTKLHIRLLEKYGPCAIHRKSFEPVKKFLIRQPSD